jgi:hypothetical protein
MQRLPHTFCPVGQLHEPPAPEHVSPVTGQPVAGQQLVEAMHALLVAQNVCPVGQLHEPPGPEQVPPAGHWASVQHWLDAMHALKGGEAIVHTVPLFGQMQFPPGPVQLSPVARQSLLVQQVSCGMQVLFTAQTLVPVGQVQEPPGPEHVSPVTVQSAFVQQAVLGMQALFPTQAV